MKWNEITGANVSNWSNINMKMSVSSFSLNRIEEETAVWCRRHWRPLCRLPSCRVAELPSCRVAELPQLPSCQVAESTRGRGLPSCRSCRVAELPQLPSCRSRRVVAVAAAAAAAFGPLTLCSLLLEVRNWTDSFPYNALRFCWLSAGSSYQISWKTWIHLKSQSTGQCFLTYHTFY